MATRIKRDKSGKPIRNEFGFIVRTKPNTRTGAMVVIPNDYRAETLECGDQIWGTLMDIDSGIRKHMEYCPFYVDRNYPKEADDE